MSFSLEPEQGEWLQRFRAMVRGWVAATSGFDCGGVTLLMGGTTLKVVQLRPGPPCDS